ncbi:cytochrome AA3 biosynthesis protein [Halobacteriales archaeon QS_5_68_33]|nr:MAG: cytochrome AA3 biosynthesis protein [Halobacteriales archaeon QS_5_68_33]
MDFRFRHLVLGTTGLTFGLILLGVYTGAMGAGLACAGRWPLCDGAVFGLFPANWPSFIEWFHRFVAMVTGFAILGTAVAAWRGDHERRTRYASAVALAVLPVQVLLGANTVFNFGVLAQVAHHAAALTILVSLVAATAWSFEESSVESATEADADAAVETGAGARADD